MSNAQNVKIGRVDKTEYWFTGLHEDILPDGGSVRSYIVTEVSLSLSYFSESRDKATTAEYDAVARGFRCTSTGKKDARFGMRSRILPNNTTYYELLIELAEKTGDSGIIDAARNDAARHQDYLQTLLKEIDGK